MPFYEMTRNPLVAAKPRMQAWWDEVKLRVGRGTTLWQELAHIARGKTQIVAGNEQMNVRYELFRSIRGWDGEEDGYGCPVLIRKVPASEERRLLETLKDDPGFQRDFADHCTLDPRLPRRIRREAQKAQRKLDRLRAKREAAE